MSSNRPVININQSFSSIYDAFYFSNDPEKILRPKEIPGTKYGPYGIELRDFGAKAGSVSQMDFFRSQRIALELTGGQDKQLTTKTVNDFLREALSGVERETQGGALSAMVGYGLPKGHVSSLDFSKKTRPLSLVFGNPRGEAERAGGHWEEGSSKVWLRNEKEMTYGRGELGRMLRHETGHIVSTGIERNVGTLGYNIRTGSDQTNTRSIAGAGFDFFDAAGRRMLPPLEDETLRYSWMRQQILSTYREKAVQPSHISEMMFRAMEQNARPKHQRSFLSIAASSWAFDTTIPNRKFIRF